MFDCLTVWCRSSGPPGEHAELQRQDSADGHSFQQGDKVKSLLEVEILRQMQEGHGGWNPKMGEVPHHSRSLYFKETCRSSKWQRPTEPPQGVSNTG